MLLVDVSERNKWAPHPGVECERSGASDEHICQLCVCASANAAFVRVYSFVVIVVFNVSLFCVHSCAIAPPTPKSVRGAVLRLRKFKY